MIVLISVLISIAALVFWQYLKFARIVKDLCGVFSDPGGNFFIGITLDFIDPLVALENITKLFHKYKNNVLLNGFFLMKLFCFERELAEAVLTTNMDKTDEYQFLHLWLFDGLITSKSEKWQTQRKLLANGFTLNFYRDSILTFNKCGKILLERLSNEKHSFNIHPFLESCSLDIICEVALGTCLNSQRNPKSDYFKSVKLMFELFFERSFSLGRLWPFYPYFFPSLRNRELKAAKILNDFTKEAIEKRKVAPNLNIKETLLSLLTKTNLEDVEIAKELNTFIFAGHDTSSSTLSFILYTLAHHPEIQETVFNEIQTFVGPNEEPTYEQLQSLSYTAMVIKEVLRLYPIVPIFSRKLTKPLKFKNKTLPVGLEIYVIAFAMHRNEEFFPDAEKFDPDRFKNNNKIPTYAYLPFCQGPRNCIGQKFAVLEIKALLVHILRKFQLLPDPSHKLQLVTSVTLQSKSGFNIKLKQRNCFFVPKTENKNYNSFM